jgi:hypothetical protein
VLETKLLGKWRSKPNSPTNEKELCVERSNIVEFEKQVEHQESLNVELTCGDKWRRALVAWGK